MNSNLEPRERRYLNWTPELVARFWDHWATSQDSQDQYFTFQVGSEIANFLGYIVDLRRVHVLDYGCGPGYLVEHLLVRGARVTAADYSVESVNRVNDKFVGRQGWEGAVRIDDGTIAVGDSRFDVITCVETIEHMFEEPRRKMLAEFRRILRSRGRVMLTTPNDENLSGHNIFCPQCGHAFHRMQHICSWSKETLGRFLHEEKFEVDFCEGLDFRRWGARQPKPLIDRSIRDIGRSAFDGLVNIVDRLSPKPFPHGHGFRHRLRARPQVHLVAIATKPSTP